MKEVWKPIEGYEGLYEVSNLGRVRSLDRVVYRPYKGHPHWPMRIKGKLLSCGTDRGGYSFVILQNKSKSCRLVHRLVAGAFMLNTESKEEINHIDGNKKNNCVTNLEFCTPSENMRHAVNTGLRKLTRVRAIEPKTGKVFMAFRSVADAQEYFGNRNTSNISNALNGRSKTAYGYRWEYA